MNPFMELKQLGQSIWYDGIGRSLIESGTIKDWTENNGLAGITSNPTIFEKAIGGGTDYDHDLKNFFTQPIGVKEIYEAIAIRDIQDAADILLPVYEKTNARDGYVSLEVSPDLAYDTAGTLVEARCLFKRVGRKNLMIKVPGTKEGVPAIEQLIAEGVNINVTLLFSVSQYEEVARAYLAGLQKRADAGNDIRKVASVASFFVSRIDTQIDAALSAKQAETADIMLRQKYEALLGKAAIANAKIAYLKFQEMILSAQFLRLLEKGAMPQRLLWASTGTKNKRYSDTYYVEALIGNDTINTIPAETFSAFGDHGKVANNLTLHTEEAQRTMVVLAESGIDFQAVSEKLLSDGVLLFSDSFDKLLATLHKKRAQSIGQAQSPAGAGPLLSASLGRWSSKVSDRMMKLKTDRVLQRIWKKDPRVWCNDPQVDMPILMGWLDIIDQELETVDTLTAFAKEIAASFKDVVLIGIGGSSLCPKVLLQMFGPISNFPSFHVLDSIVPSAILSLERTISLTQTLFIVSSKSGSTIEPMTLTEYFLKRLTEVKGEEAGRQFVAITDPGSPFSQYAKQNGFRRILEGVADIGGRYSALSHFGMVPAAIMGIDIEVLLKEAKKMSLLCDPYIPYEENPSANLGVTIGQLAKEGLDKLTFISSPTVQPFEFWLEQLIAESTGKDGQGIIPIVHETPIGGVRTYVYIRHHNDNNADRDRQVSALEGAGYPVIRVSINDIMEIGGQFFLWEMATAVAGSILNVNPFDQPNVESSKNNTRALLSQGDKMGNLSEERPIFSEEGIALYANFPVIGAGLKDALAAIIESISADHFVAIDAYLQETDSIQKGLEAIRGIVQNKKNVATTLGFGPSYLHSSGQLQKGGPNTILAIIISSEAKEDIPIPGKNYTFGKLAIAQAIGDYQSLDQGQRHVVRVHLSVDISDGLDRLITLLG